MNTCQIEQERARYTRLHMISHEQGRQILEKELHEAGVALAGYQESLSRLLLSLQSRSGSWLQRWFKPRRLEDVAAAEFDALVHSPYVAAVECDRAKLYLLITTAPVAPLDAGQSVAAPVRLNIALDSGTLGVDPAPPPARRPTLDLVAAALIAAGELAGLVALMVEPHHPSVRASRPAIGAERARSAYIQCRTALLQDAQAGSQQQKEAEAQIASIIRQMSSMVHRVHIAERGLAELEAVEQRAADYYSYEFDMLCRLPGVASLAVVGNTIRVQTEPISLHAEGSQHRIGRFRIDIYPGMRVEMHNLDKTIASSSGHYDHPHIYNDQPCWGDSQSFFATQLARQNFPAIIQQALEFLRSYNPNSAFVSPMSWIVGNALRTDSTRSWDDDY